MLSLGPLAFGAPLALLGLLALPLLWMLLRATPPAPREVAFAPLRLLQRLARTPETPEATPWWLVILRLLLAALAILALARPVLQPEPATLGEAPLLVIVDDGWAGAQTWSALSDAARVRLEAARADGRDAALLFTAAPPGAAPLEFGDASNALSRLAAHDPRPWPADRTRAADRLAAALSEDGAPRRIETVWLADGLSGEGEAELSRTASARGALRVLLPPASDSVLGLTAIEASPDGFTAVVRRANPEIGAPVSAIALGADGRAIARATGAFEPGETEARLEARLPLDLRNRIARVEVEGARSAGLVHLTGDRWLRPRVGLIGGAGEDAQPLLSDLHYAREALSGSAELVTGDLETVLAAEPAALVLTDAARADAPEIERFAEAGGLVLRFAGPRLAANPDGILPVRLRTGGRLFGGALAWDDPQGLAAFPEDSPFAGLRASGEVEIRRQVLAEPGPALDARVWARLEDGTPLVTAERRGDGWVVLFHVTAGPDWSSLPLSGLYPAMLERTLALSGGSRAPAPTGGAWRLEAMLDGSGALTEPSDAAQPIPSDAFSQARASAETPPGLWTLGAASAALNTLQPGDTLQPMARTLPGAVIETRGETREIRFAGPLLVLAALLLIADTLIGLVLSGRMPKLPRTGAAAAMLAAPLLAIAAQGEAAAQDSAAAHGALDVRFGYVLTGDARTDAISRAGLSGLSRESTRRSAVEPAEPVGVTIETDEILFYPLIYWPVSETAPPLSEAAAAKVGDYLQEGGLIVFDTRDGGIGRPGDAPHPGLVRILDAIDVPPLQPVPDDHVIGRAFYLLDDYPGRFPGGQVWVEAIPEGSARDGVSGVVIGSADWASAWALDEEGRPLAPVEGGEYQRELSIRFGVNLAMYALTGNYKADQVHVPAILERLGRD
ncbi:MAG: DUF4159 domain-containing protein [Oceanicaulis sp.]